MMGFGLSLRVLRLIAVDVSGEIIEHLLSHCPPLELTQVHGTRSLASLSVAGGPSLALKHLDLDCFSEVNSMEIVDAQNLVLFFFRCGGQKYSQLRLHMRNVAMLVEAHLCLGVGYDSVDRSFYILSLSAIKSASFGVRGCQRRVYRVLLV